MGKQSRVEDLKADKIKNKPILIFFLRLQKLSICSLFSKQNELDKSSIDLV